MSDDITFCGSDCDNKKCFRHPSNIREQKIPHSFAYMKGTEDCPYGAKKTMTPDDAVERVISILQSCKGSDGCLGYIERYFYEEDEQAIDIAIHLLKEGEIYMTAEDFNLYMEGYKQGRKDFERQKGEWKDHSNEGYVECPFFNSATTCEDNIDELHYCFNCGAELRRGEIDENSN